MDVFIWKYDRYIYIYISCKLSTGRIFYLIAFSQTVPAETRSCLSVRSSTMHHSSPHRNHSVVNENNGALLCHSQQSTNKASIDHCVLKATLLQKQTRPTLDEPVRAAIDCYLHELPWNAKADLISSHAGNTANDKSNQINEIKYSTSVTANICIQC